MDTIDITKDQQKQAERSLATAIVRLGDARDALSALGADVRSAEIRDIMLKLGTILKSV